MSDVSLTAKQEAALHEIHSTYHSLIVPLLAPLAQVRGLYINPLYNEIRALFSHITRVYNPQLRAKSREIEKARGHLDRLTLDIFKIYALHFADELQRFEKSYSHVNLSGIDGGKFYSRYFTLKADAEKQLTEAKRHEHLEAGLSFTYYQDSYIQYSRLLGYIRSLTSDIQRKSCRHRIWYWISMVFTISLPIATAFLSNYLCAIVKTWWEHLFP